jgi:2-oxo-4-hydroxy-4-carboxy-5-ureidoimidazoline decarboxylase
MDLATLNRAPRDAAVLELLACCASAEWAAAMADRRPFEDANALLVAAADEWWIRAEDDWLEAFAAHPRIGEQRSGTDRHTTWSRLEQAGVAGADAATRDALVECNRDYEARFGYEFLICATGMSAAAMLEACRTRIDNDPDEEFLEAAGEQEKITALRLRKLLEID